jgi:AraC-like DNA-binding protein
MSDATALYYREIAPHPALREWVKCYWVLHKRYAPSDCVESILPDGCIDLIFYAGGTFYAALDGDLIPNGALIGPLSQILMLFSPSPQPITTFGVRFYPYGLYPFLRVPLHEMVNQIVDAGQLFDGAIPELSDRVTEGGDPDAIVGWIDRFLCGRLSANLYDAQFVKWVSHLLGQQPESNSIADLAMQANTTARTLQRKVAQVTGFTPKMLARVIRFNRLKNNLMLQPNLELTDLALRFAYFDQAHFIHDFRQFTGLTPTAFLQQVNDRHIRFYK